MTYQYSVALRDRKLAQIQVIVGSSGTLQIFSGPEPSNCSQPDPSGLLCTIALPGVFLTGSGGSVALAGAWEGTAIATGVAQSWRIKDAQSNCHVQGNISDMTLNNTSFTHGQTVTVTTFNVTAGNV